MSQLGVGAMIHQLGGGSEHNADEFYGKKIINAKLEDDRVKIDFEDGVKIDLWDNGQSCCESRYITTDDDVSSLIGGTLRLIEPKKHEEKEGEYGDSHEQIFIEIATEKSSVTVVTHNEHNGYYGGFGLTITERT